MVLRAELDDSSSVYISPVSMQTYAEQIGDGALGDASGYFVLRSRKSGTHRLEILAKASSLEAAEQIFDLIVGANRVRV